MNGQDQFVDNVQKDIDTYTSLEWLFGQGYKHSKDNLVGGKGAIRGCLPDKMMLWQYPRRYHGPEGILYCGTIKKSDLCKATRDSDVNQSFARLCEWTLTHLAKWKKRSDSVVLNLDDSICVLTVEDDLGAKTTYFGTYMGSCAGIPWRQFALDHALPALQLQDFYEERIIRLLMPSGTYAWKGAFYMKEALLDLQARTPADWKIEDGKIVASLPAGIYLSLHPSRYYFEGRATHKDVTVIRSFDSFSMGVKSLVTNLVLEVLRKGHSLHPSSLPIWIHEDSTALLDMEHRKDLKEIRDLQSQIQTKEAATAKLVNFLAALEEVRS